MVAVISVHAYPFFGFLSRDLLTCHLEVTEREVYHQRFHVNRLLVFIRGQHVKGLLSCKIQIRNNFKAKATFKAKTTFL